MEIYQCDADGSNGHWVKVDMVRTVTGIEKYKGQDGYIALGENLTNTVYVGLEEVKTTSTFYKAGTTTKVSLKSNVTLKDIDSNQYIGVKANKVNGQYVSKDTKLSYKEDNGTYIYYADTDKDYDSEDLPVQRSHLKEIVLNILLDEILQSQQDMISLWEVDRTWFDLKLPHLSKVLPITMK